MTNQNTAARVDGPTENQIRALQARARAAGISEAELCSRVGGSTFPLLTRDQTRRLFDLTNGDRGDDRGEERPRPPGTAIVPANGMDLVLSEFGYTAEEADVICAVIAPECTLVEVRYLVLEARERHLNLLAGDAYGAKIHGKPVLIPGVDWTRATVEPELAGPVTIEMCDAPLPGQAPNYVSPIFFHDHKPVGGRARAVRRDNLQEYVYEGLYSEHHRTENAWRQYDIHMYGLSLERQLYRHMFAEKLRGLNLELPPPEELEDAARVYMWAQTSGAGLDHAAVHRLFGIASETPLGPELERRGMDWRDAVKFVGNQIRGGGRAALGEPVTLRLNGGDTRRQFWEEARGAGLDEAGVCRELALGAGPPDFSYAGAVDREAERVGWPELTLRLRTLIAKRQRNAAIDASQPAGFQHDGTAPELLYGPEETPSSPVSKQEPPQNPNGEPRSAARAPDTREQGSLPAAAAEPSEGPASSEADTKADVKPDIERTAGELRRDAATEVVTDDLDVCAVCGERPPVELVDAIPTCQQCLDRQAAAAEREVRFIPMPESVHDRASLYAACGDVLLVGREKVNAVVRQLYAARPAPRWEMLRPQDYAAIWRAVWELTDAEVVGDGV